jgi:hypothetical protein
MISCKNPKTEKSEKYIKDSHGKIYIAILENYKWQKAIPTGLTKKEVEIVNEILPKAVEKMNSDSKKMFDNPSSERSNINLNNYLRQYFPYINKDTGKKEVFINCFCRARNNKWLTDMVMVDGGGSCYFYGTIYLENETFNDFMINAPL